MLRRGMRVLIHYVKRRGGARRILEPDANPPAYTSRTGRPFPYSPAAYGLHRPIYDRNAGGWRVFAPAGVTRIEAVDPESGDVREDYRRWIGSRVERPEKHAADAIERTGSVRRDRFYPKGTSPVTGFSENYWPGEHEQPGKAVDAIRKRYSVELDGDVDHPDSLTTLNRLDGALNLTRHGGIRMRSPFLIDAELGESAGRYEVDPARTPRGRGTIRLKPTQWVPSDSSTNSSVHVPLHEIGHAIHDSHGPLYRELKASSWRDALRRSLSEELAPRAMSFIRRQSALEDPAEMAAEAVARHLHGGGVSRDLLHVMRRLGMGGLVDRQRVIDRTRNRRFRRRGHKPGFDGFAEDADMSMTFAERFRRRFADSDSVDLGLRATYVCIRLPDYIASNYPPKAEDASGAHITVQYFGEQSKPWARRLADALGERLKAWKSFTVCGAGRGVFEKAEDGKDAVYTPVHDAERKLHALRELVAHAAKDIGGEWESKYPEYIPHVTIRYVEHGEAMSVDAPSEWTATVDHVEVAWGDEKVSKVPFGTPQHVPMPRSFVESLRQRVAFMVGNAEAGPGQVNHFTPGVRGFRRQRRRGSQAFALRDISNWDKPDAPLSSINPEERRITGLRGLTGAQRKAASRGERVDDDPRDTWTGSGPLLHHSDATATTDGDEHLLRHRLRKAGELRSARPGTARDTLVDLAQLGEPIPETDIRQSLGVVTPMTAAELRTAIEAQSGIGRISRLERQPLAAAMRRGLPGLPAKGTFSADQQAFAAPRSRMLPGTSGAGQFVREHIPGQYRANVARALGVQQMPVPAPQQQFGIADRIASAGRKVTSIGKWWLNNINPAPTYRAARGRGMGRLAAGATTAGAHIADLALTGGKAPIAVAATRKWLSRGQPAESQGFAVTPQVPDEMNPPYGYGRATEPLPADNLDTAAMLRDYERRQQARASAAAQRSHYSPERRIHRILAMANSYIDSAPGEDPIPDPSLVETLPDARRYGLVKQERQRRAQGFMHDGGQDFAKVQIPARTVEIPDTLLRRIVPAAAWGVTPTGGITRPFREQQFGAISRRIGTAAGGASRWMRSGIAGMKREMGPQARNRLSGAGYGMAIGGVLGGPVGAAVGGGAGALLGMRGIGQAARPTLLGAAHGAVGVGRALKTGVNAVADATGYVRRHGVGGTIKQGIGAVGRGLSAAGRGLASGLGQTGRVLGAAGAEVGRQAVGGIKSAAGDAWRDMRAGYQSGSSAPSSRPTSTRMQRMSAGGVGPAAQGLSRRKWSTAGSQGFALDQGDDNEPWILKPSGKGEMARRPQAAGSFIRGVMNAPAPSEQMIRRVVRRRGGNPLMTKYLQNRMDAVNRDATKFEMDGEQADPDAQYFARRSDREQLPAQAARGKSRPDYRSKDLRYALERMAQQARGTPVEGEAQSALTDLGTVRPSELARGKMKSVGSGAALRHTDLGAQVTAPNIAGMLNRLQGRAGRAGRLRAILESGIRGRALPVQEGRRVYGAPDFDNLPSIKSMRNVSRGSTVDALRKATPMRHGVEALADLASQDDWRADRRAASIQRQWQKSRDRAAYLARLTNRDAQIPNPARVNQARRNAGANDDRANAMLGVQPADVPVEVVTGEPAKQGAPRWGRPKRDPIPLSKEQAKTWIGEAEKYIGPRSSVRFPDALELASRREGRSAELKGGEKYRRFSDVERERAAGRNVGSKNRLAVDDILRGDWAFSAEAPRHPKHVLQFADAGNRASRFLIKREGSKRQQQDVGVEYVSGNVTHRKHRHWVS